MKTFRYTARDRSGALKNGAVTAGSRAEALGKLKALQLVPVSVAEGARPRSGPAGMFHAALFKRAAFVAALAAAGAFVIFKFVVFQAEKPAGTGVEPAVTDRGAGGTAVKPPAMPPAEAEPALPATATVGEKIPAPPDAVAVKPDNETAPVPEAVKPVIVSDLRPGKTNSPPDGLSSGTERILNAMVSSRLGGPPPPLLYFPPHEATNLVAVLSRDIVVFDDDDAAAVAKKENLAAVKQKLKEYLQGGGRAEDFMVYYRDILSQAHAERTEMQQAYAALRKSGDGKAAAEYFEAANKALMQKGYLPLSAPPGLRKKE